jgi:DNA-binding GntR family transcriptional regulator
MPIREAIQRLESIGLIQSIPYKGAYVGELNAADIREIFELRKLVEGYAVRRAVPRLSPDDLEELAELLGRADAEMETGKTELYFEGDRCLHDLFLQNCGNRRFAEVLEPFARQVESFRFSAGQLPGDHRTQSHGEHKRVLEAAMRGDADEAARRMEAHIEDALERVLRLLGESSEGRV